MLSVAFIKDDKNVVCGTGIYDLYYIDYFFKIIIFTGEGVINIFNYDEWANISDRFPGHPSSVDCILPISRNVILTGCFDGNIRF
jgi:hypothetical protein